MNAYMNKNTGKILVAVLAMAMVIAGAAVVLSDNGVNATTQKQDDFLSAVSDGTYTLTEDKEVEIKTPLTISSNNLSGGSLTINGNFTLTLTFAATASYQSMIDGVDITVGEGASVKIVMTGEGFTNTHIFQDLSITIQNGGTLTISQSSEGQSWYNSGAENLIMYGNANMVFDAANGISNVAADLNGTSAITVQNAQFANLTFKSLDMKSGTSVRILDGDSEDTNINIGANSTIAGTVDANNSNIYFTSGITVGNAGGSISASQMKVLATSDNPVSITINGGSVSGEFVAGTYNNQNVSTTINMNGVSVNDVTYADGVSLGEGSSVIMSGNLGIGDTINADLTVEDMA